MKSVSTDLQVTYTVYDIITMSSTQFSIDPKVYLLVGDKIFIIKVEFLEHQYAQKISERKNRFSLQIQQERLW